MAISLVTLGAAEYHLGSHAEATALHQQSLALFGEVENRREIAECLEVLAMLARAQDQPSQAARLFGTAEAAPVSGLRTWRTGSLPVVVVSAYPRVLTPVDEESVACVQNKPLQIEKLLAAVRQVLTPDTGSAPAADPEGAGVDSPLLIAVPS